MLGFLYSLRKDLFEAEPKTKSGLIMVFLSIEILLELPPSFEFFLALSYLLPNDVLDSLIVSGSASFILLYSILYLDFGNIFENYFLSLGIFIVFNKFCVVLLFFNDSLMLDFGASNF